MKEIRLCDDGKPEQTAALCQKAGVGIEVQSFHDPYIHKSAVETHKAILSAVPGGKSLHAPYWDLTLGTKIKELRKTTLQILNNAYAIATELGCTEMIVHAGYKPGTYWYDGWTERAASLLQEFLQDKQITICIENQFETDSELLINLIDTVGDPRVRVCLDVGHINANSNASAEDWIKSLGARIAYYHLHNNHGKQTVRGYNKDDEHLGLRHGTLDIAHILRLAQIHSPNAIWALESHPDYHEEDLNLLQNA